MKLIKRSFAERVMKKHGSFRRYTRKNPEISQFKCMYEILLSQKALFCAAFTYTYIQKYAYIFRILNVAGFPYSPKAKW